MCHITLFYIATKDLFTIFSPVNLYKTTIHFQNSSKSMTVHMPVFLFKAWPVLRVFVVIGVLLFIVQIVSTTIYDGVTAYRFVVNKLAANYYFVENGFDINDSAAYDKRTYTTAVGDKLRAHPLVVGEEFVTTKITGTLSAGTEYGVKTDGTIG